MQTYFFHKAYAIGFVIILWLSGYILFGQDQIDKWYTILIITMVIGYSHYFIGAIYQWLSFKRRPHPFKNYVLFIIFSILSIIFCLTFYTLNQTQILAFGIIGYFMLHGYYNEITLFQRQSNLAADPIGFIVPPLFLFGLAMLAIGHPSWFFNGQLEFVPALHEPFTMQTIGFIVGAVSTVIAIGVCFRQAIVSVKYRSKLIATALALIGLGVWAATSRPINYMFIFSLLLLYHFVVWFLFFFAEFKNKAPERLPAYLVLHAVVFLFFSLALTKSSIGILVSDTFLNSPAFLLATMIHITTSFMSEPWFRKFFSV